MPVDGADGGLHLQARRRVGGMHTDLRRRPTVQDDLFFKPQQQRGAGAPFCRSDISGCKRCGAGSPVRMAFLAVAGVSDPNAREKRVLKGMLDAEREARR